MDCQAFEAFVEDRLAEGVTPERAAAAARHASVCPRCRELEALLRTDAEPVVGDVPGALLEAVLERTSRPLARAAARLARELPLVAERDPGPGFCEAVLRRTSRGPGARLRRRMAELRRAIRLAYRRPRLALEGAYLAVLLVTAVLGIMGASPWALAAAAVEVGSTATRSLEGLGARAGQVAPAAYRDLAPPLTAALATARHTASSLGDDTCLWLDRLASEAARRVRAATPALPALSSDEVDEENNPRNGSDKETAP